MRFAVDAWAPSYGAAADDVAGDSVDPTASVEPFVESPEASWAPRRPPAPAPHQVVAFVDGVTRVEAQVWISERGGDVRPGLCASYAAGIVHCDGAARVGEVRVDRGLFTASGEAEPIVTRHARFDVKASAGDLDALSLAVIERMRKLEADVAREAGDAALVVLDGLLWGRADVPRAIGYVKTHRASYLAGPINEVVTRLQPGERTPLFLVATTWNRYSWYMRLPGGHGHPWSGVVRCEVSPDIPIAEAVAMADLATATLPRFASSPHKDPRAPQNLYPIGGLERELHRRLGDRDLIYRSLRTAAGRAPEQPVAGDRG